MKEMRKTIKNAAPKAKEAISYGIPTFTYFGNLVHFGAFKHHIGFFPGSEAIKSFAKDLKKYKTSKGTIQFQYDEPIPFGLVTKIVKFRVKVSDAKKK